MTDLLSRRKISALILFLSLEALILFARLLPVNVGATGWPRPELGLCLLLAWLIRRPDQIPALAVVGFTLLEDIILYRPIGLWAAIVLIASEAVRTREARWRDQQFVLEWLRVSLLIAVMMLCYRVALFLFLLPVPALDNAALQYLLTVISYPLVVFAARWIVGLRRISSAELEMKRKNR